MSVFVIADLHLSTNRITNKSMEVFGKRWTGYTEKLQKNWKAVVSEEDTVIIPGDISWALTPEEALPDLLFLNALPGKKLIGKGNHDYWWATAKKLSELFSANGIHTISLLHNTAYDCSDFIAVGTRGWFNDGSLKMPPNTDYAKLVNRENERLKLSLAEARRLCGDEDREIIAFLHFPPVRGSFVCRPLVDTLKEAGITRCFYGHIHGDYLTPQTACFEGISFSLIAADYLNFLPMPVFPEK
ncbi:MAG: metallophosphoesterase [Eubacteriales bacterium]|nr:metallophosphoesterase [Eubacteriales bacterium]